MFDLFYSSTKLLLRKWKRTLLTALSIAIGVASVILISSLGTTGVELIDSEIAHLGLQGLVITPDNKLTEYRPGDDVCRELMTMDEIKYASGSSLDTGLVRMHGMISNSIIWGVGENYEQVMSIPLLYGRAISRAETQNGAQICLVDYQTAKEFYQRKNIVGKVLSLEYNGKRTDLEIVGIVEAGGNGLQNMLGDYIPSFLYVPAKTFENITGKKGYSQISIKTDEEVMPDKTEVIALVERMSGRENKFILEDLSEKNERLSLTLGRVSQTLSIIAVISLIVAAVGTMAIMMAAVKERTREIGIKKSVGASNGRIMAEFLVESILISCFGTIIGSLVSSMLIVIAGKTLPEIPFEIDGAGLAAMVCIALGTVFGMIPAYQAAKMNPIESLRNEA